LRDRPEQSRYTVGWQYIPFVLFAVSLFFSRFALSVSVGLMFIWTLVMLKQKDWSLSTVLKPLDKKILIVLSVWILLLLLDGFRAVDRNAWTEDLLLKIPLLVVPLYIILLPKNDCGYSNSWLIFVVVTTGVALISTIQYWVNYEEINQLLLQSKHVPIFGITHHIYFGVIMAVCIWTCLYFYNQAIFKKIWLSCGVLLLFFMHILASRTGLVTFYLSALVYLIGYTAQKKKFKTLIVGLIAMICLPIVGYNLSGSFKNKVANSIEDFNAIKSGADINYKSLAMRIEAWKTSADVISDHYLIGVGSGNVEKHLQHQYVVNETVLYPENRVGPHNQLLEMVLAHGIIGGILLSLIVFFWFWKVKSSPVLLAMSAVIIGSFFLESFLERQQGILIFCVFLFSFIPLPSRGNKETEY
jgi:O-antigen ligase